MESSGLGWVEGSSCQGEGEIYEGEERMRDKVRGDDSTEEKKTKRNVMKGKTRDIWREKKKKIGKERTGQMMEDNRREEMEWIEVW